MSDRDIDGAVAFFACIAWFMGLVLIAAHFGGGWVGVALVASIGLDNFTVTIKRKD